MRRSACHAAGGQAALKDMKAELVSLGLRLSDSDDGSDDESGSGRVLKKKVTRKTKTKPDVKTAQPKQSAVTSSSDAEDGSGGDDTDGGRRGDAAAPTDEPRRRRRHLAEPTCSGSQRPPPA
jgi:hypothetical protein